MEFINLNELKVTKEFNYTTIDMSLEITDLDMLVPGAVKEALLAFFSPLDEIKGEFIYYRINLIGEIADPGEFLHYVNLINAVFFLKFTDKTKRRDKEYRLDAPEKLRKVHLGRNILKDCANYCTKCNVFNLEINAGEYKFIACDGKDADIDGN